MITRGTWVVVAVAGATVWAPVQAATGRARERRSRTSTAVTQTKADDVACLAAYREASLQIQAGELRAARDRLLTCARPACGGGLERRCSLLFGQLVPEIPSVIPLVKNGSGEVRSNVKVAMDDQPLASGIDGRALMVDPGWHQFIFTAADGEVIGRRSVLIVQGQRNRPIEIQVPASAPTAPADTDGGGDGADRAASDDGTARRRPPKSAASPPSPPRKNEQEEPQPSPSRPPPRARPKLAVKESIETAEDLEESLALDTRPARKGAERPVLAYTLGAVGLAGLATGALLTHWGRADNDRLAQCAPSCSSGAVDHIRRTYIGADVAAGVGVAALIGATWAYFRGEAQSERTASRASSGLLLGLQSSHAGVVASVEGQF